MHPIVIPPGSQLIPSHPIVIPGDPPITIPPGTVIKPEHPIWILPPDYAPPPGETLPMPNR
jgi:hypothetical protein